MELQITSKSIHILLLLLSGLQDLERAEQAFVDTHHGTGVVKLSAVIGRAEQGNELAFRKELVTILDDLMGTTYEIHVMLLQESGHYIWAEREGHTTVVFAPPGDVLVRIGPEKVAEQTAIGDLKNSQLLDAQWKP